MSKKLLIGCGAVAALIVCIIALVAVFAVAGIDDEPPAVAEATAVVATPVPLLDTPVPPPEDTPVVPTNTPTPPTPTPPAPAFEIVTHRHYVDSIDYEHIIGVVQNVSPEPMQFVEVVVTLYDAAGDVVGTGFTYADLDTVAPGERSGFDVADDEWGEWAEYKLQVQSDPGRPPRRDVVLQSHRQYVDDIGYLHVEGEVQNTGTEPAEFVQVNVVFYEANNEVAGVAFSYADIDTLAPGGTSPFDVTTDDYFEVSHYEVVVQAD